MFTYVYTFLKFIPNGSFQRLVIQVEGKKNQDYLYKKLPLATVTICVALHDQDSEQAWSHTTTTADMWY